MPELTCPPPAGRAERKEDERLTVSFGDGAKAWLKGVASHEGVSISEAVRRVVERARSEKWERADNDPPERRSRKKKFLEQVRELFEPALAAERSGVSRKELEAWMQDGDFAAEVDWAQDIYLGQIQEGLIKIGKAQVKANPVALIAPLNAHHYAYGRIRVETIRQIVDPLIQEFADDVAEELPAHLEVLRRVHEKFARKKEIRLATFAQ